MDATEEGRRKRALRELTFALYLPTSATMQQIDAAIDDVSDRARRDQLRRMLARIKPWRRR